MGHDWGALPVYRIATAYDVPLRSWIADCASILHPDYVWHDVARIWQTPAHARAMHERFDEPMGRAILGLYRSALPNPYADWGAGLAGTSAPGLVLTAADDPFDDQDVARDIARGSPARRRRW
ncbi:hypothetical protein [Streptomyces olindensis]|uniref:hypothetical protein n=1 Tax=Streptomyces olindensis TaxID=358823 RepID=UPI0033D27AD7